VNPTESVYVTATVKTYKRTNLNTPNTPFVRFTHPRFGSSFQAQSGMRYIETSTVLTPVVLTISDTGIIPFEIDVPYDAIRISIEVSVTDHNAYCKYHELNYYELPFANDMHICQ
jgi:hypothetical protein